MNMDVPMCLRGPAFLSFDSVQSSHHVTWQISVFLRNCSAPGKLLLYYTKVEELAMTTLCRSHLLLQEPHSSRALV